jgi:hypothetical protein
MTNFILTKNNLTCHTYLLSIVRILRSRGWKVQHNELSTLI